MWPTNGPLRRSLGRPPSVGDTNLTSSLPQAISRATAKRTSCGATVVTGANVVWLMNGSTFAASAMLPTVSDLNWTIAGTGDFQRDGKSDVLWHNVATGNNVIWFMDGLDVAYAVPASCPRHELDGRSDRRFLGRRERRHHLAQSNDRSQRRLADGRGKRFRECDVAHCR